ncbi:MAG: hypothetical protein KatS3mg110_1720 [Pirellulaceae bacterium]|nr:MAG: hypothetical protein KatS3mg110_1720 [Pirellulaceae bacterium]
MSGYRFSFRAPACRPVAAGFPPAAGRDRAVNAEGFAGNVERSPRATWSEFACVAAGQVATALGAITGVRLLTEVLPPAEFGLYMLAMTGSILAQQLVFAPLGAAAQRFLAAAIEQQTLRSFLEALAFLAVASVVLVIGVAAPVAGTLAGCGKGTLAGLVLATSVFTVVWGLATLLDSIHTAARWRRLVAVNQTVTQWLRWVGAAGLAWLWQPSAAAAMYGATAAVLLASAGRCLAVRRLPLEPPQTARPSGPWRRRLLRYLLPFSTWGVFTWAGTASDRWALALYASTYDVGLYAVLYQLGYFPCVLLGDAIQQFLGPVLFGRIGDGADPQRLAHALRWHRSVFWPAVALFAGGWLAAWNFAGPIVAFLAAPDYRAYASGLPLLVAAGALFSLGQILALAIIGTCGSAALLPAKIGCAVLTVAANFGAVRWAGPQGLLVAMPITAACYLLATAWQCHRIQLRWATADAEPTGETRTERKKAA